MVIKYYTVSTRNWEVFHNWTYITFLYIYVYNQLASTTPRKLHTLTFPISVCVVPNQLLNIHTHTYLIWQKIQFPQLNSNPGHCYSPTQVDTRRMSWPSAPLLSWYDPITETGPKKQSHVHTNSTCHINQLRGVNTLNEKDPRSGLRGLPLVPGYPQRRWPNFLGMMSLINCAQIRPSAVVLTRWSDGGKGVLVSSSGQWSLT